jgi:hypothetical protein
VLMLSFEDMRMRLGFEAVLDRREGVLLWGDKGTIDEVDLFGRFKVREGGWRIRSNPDGPSPCSCSSREDLQYIKIRSQYRCFCTITCNILRNARGSVNCFSFLTSRDHIQRKGYRPKASSVHHAVKKTLP